MSIQQFSFQVLGIAGILAIFWGQQALSYTELQNGKVRILGYVKRTDENVKPIRACAERVLNRCAVTLKDGSFSGHKSIVDYGNEEESCKSEVKACIDLIKKS